MKGKIMISKRQMGLFSYLEYKDGIAGIIWMPKGEGGHIPIVQINDIYYSQKEKNPNFDRFKYFSYILNKVKKRLKELGYKEFHLVSFHLFYTKTMGRTHRANELRRAFLTWIFLDKLRYDGLKKTILSIKHLTRDSYLYNKIYEELCGGEKIQV